MMTTMLVGDEISVDAANTLVRLEDDNGAVHLRLGKADLLIESQSLKRQGTHPVGFAPPAHRLT
jgi:hypothetical protein